MLINYKLFFTIVHHLIPRKQGCSCKKYIIEILFVLMKKYCEHWKRLRQISDTPKTRFSCPKSRLFSGKQTVFPKRRSSIYSVYMGNTFSPIGVSRKHISCFWAFPTDNNPKIILSLGNTHSRTTSPLVGKNIRFFRRQETYSSFPKIYGGTTHKWRQVHRSCFTIS